MKQPLTARPKRYSAWIPPIVMLALIFILVGNLAGFEFWPLSRLVHFPVYWGLGALGLGLIAGLRKQWLTMMAALILATGFGSQLAPLFATPHSPNASVDKTSSITVMTFNVLRGNPKHQQVLTALQAEQPDVLYLTEMTVEWRKSLAPLSSIYPHHLGRNSNLLLSKFPLNDERPVLVDFNAANSYFRTSGGAMSPVRESLREEWCNTELLTASVVIGDRRVRLVGIHPPVPSDDISIFVQRAAALAYREVLQRDTTASAKVLLGDFNNTRFSPTFRFILQQTQLHDSAAGLGYTPTWGPRLPDEPWLPWLGVPIDHILVSENAQILSRDVGPPLGSDHRWVRATIRF